MWRFIERSRDHATVFSFLTGGDNMDRTLFRLQVARLTLKYALNREEPFDFVAACKHHRVLFVGEGNLSFSLSIMRRLCCFPRSEIWATTFECISAWDAQTKRHASRLMRLGAQVSDEVDATKLDQTFSRNTFDVIIFQFPNVGNRKPKHGRNPNHILLRRFLRSARALVGKSGIISLTTVNSSFYDGAFAVLDAARFAKLQPPDAYPFAPSEHPGYMHTNTCHPNESAIDHADQFVTFVFRVS